jgi:tetratricopeptide (TPR) repeat protein
MRAGLFQMKPSKAATQRLVLPALAIACLAIACLVPAMPAAAAPPQAARAQALSALRGADSGERRRGAMNLGVVGRMEDASALLAALRDEDELVRDIAEESVWAVWSRSGDARVDELFRQGVARMGERQFPAAIAAFTHVIELKPGFAEGWNKRATAYFLAGEYRQSLKDCAEVIRRNPRHFGALSGYGQIYLRLEEPEKALQYFRRALAVNPNLEGVPDTIEELESLLAARRGRMI